MDAHVLKALSYLKIGSHQFKVAHFDCLIWLQCKALVLELLLMLCKNVQLDLRVLIDETFDHDGNVEGVSDH